MKRINPNGFFSIETLTSNSKPYDEERFVQLHYKARTVKNSDGTATTIPRFPSLCVSIPQLRMNLSSFPASVASVTLSLWESLQDDLIRSLVDQKRSRDDPAKSAKHSVSEDEIALPSIAAFAAATGNGKLSSEGIASWFDLSLAEPLLTAILAADAERTDDQCAAILKGYRESFAKLAAVVPNVTQANIQQLRKAALKAPDDDQMAVRLLTKLDAMDKNRSAAVLADVL